MKVPIPTPIYRFIHIENLNILLRRGGIHAPNFTPNDGLSYRTIHNIDIQQQRRITKISCGPDGTIHDYVSFYFGPRSPMLFQLHTGRVEGYTEGQVPLIYLVTTAQKFDESGARFVFSDGHGIALYTSWFDKLTELDKIDWNAVHARIWKDTLDDLDRQRRKQAEFLVYQFCDWEWITEIGVLNLDIKSRVGEIFDQFPENMKRPVNMKPDWYY